MTYKPLIIVLCEQYRTLQEIILKYIKRKILSKYNIPILFFLSVDLFRKQMVKLGYKYKLNIIKPDHLGKKKLIIN